MGGKGGTMRRAGLDPDNDKGGLSMHKTQEDEERKMGNE